MNIRITRNVNVLNVLMKNTNIQFTLTWVGYMNFRICVPSFLCDRAIGHLGNCDGNRGNDVTMDDRCELLLPSLLCSNNCLRIHCLL